MTPGPADFGAAATANPYVVDVSEATFATEVVERSRTVPVVLDLWAAWCAPCRQLSPVLERLAAEGAGAWVLAKVDVDANPRIAQALQVQGIPAVKAVVGGELVDEFTGALPEAEIRAWLARLGVGAAPVPSGDDRLAGALAAERRGDLDAAAGTYAAVLAEDPANLDALTGAARVDLVRRARTADETALAARLAADPYDVEAAAGLADLDLVRGRTDAAFDRLLDLVRAGGDARDPARQHLLTLFAVLPPEDPALVRARRSLASALF